MDQQDEFRYRATTWRKRLERRGWTSLRRTTPPRNRLIEYHVIWQGRLISGRVQLNTLSDEGYWQPGNPVYLLDRRQGVLEGVWRLAQRKASATGQVVRRVTA